MLQTISIELCCFCDWPILPNATGPQVTLRCGLWILNQRRLRFATQPKITCLHTSHAYVPQVDWCTRRNGNVKFVLCNSTKCNCKITSLWDGMKRRLELHVVLLVRHVRTVLKFQGNLNELNFCIRCGPVHAFYGALSFRMPGCYWSESVWMPS